MNLKDKITFCVPYFEDSPHRAKNFQIFLKYWEPHVSLAVKKVESAADFHRCKILNELANSCTTPYLALADLDCITPVSQIEESVKLLFDGADFVYPYDTRPFNIDENFQKINQWPKYTINNQSMLMFLGESLGMETPSIDFGDLPLGGIFCARKYSFMDFGMENENFIGWAFEEHERYERALKLGYGIKRVAGEIWHLDHPRTSTSRSNVLWKNNYFEFLKTHFMTKDQLLAYIKTWRWMD